MVILGIDPGTVRTGYGVIDKDVSLQFLGAGLLETSAKNMHTQLLDMHRDLSRIIKKFSPALAAIESIYFNKNKKTAIQVSHARGVIIFTLALHGIPLSEYSPPQIKKAITGSGSADKQNISRVIEKILKIEFHNEHDDVSDAVAIALTAALDGSLVCNTLGPGT